MEAFYEHCACIGCMMHPPARTQLVLSSLLSGSLEHSVCSNACPLGPSSVLGHGLGCVSQFLGTFQDGMVAALL